MTWFARLWRHRRLETDLDKELRFHIEEHTADLVAQGRNPSDARRLARLELGGPEQLKEDLRDARGTRWLEDLGRDLRYALRTLRHQPAFTSVALVTLALGIGATTVMFTLINGVLLKPLPYPEPDRLLVLQEQTSYRTQMGDLWAFTYPNYVDCRDAASKSLEMAAFRFGSGTIVSESSEAEQVQGIGVSASLFDILRTRMFRGRAFTAADDRAGAAPVAIISYVFWQRHLGASPSALGSSINFNGKPYTITGILPSDFTLDDNYPDVITPLAQDTSPGMQNRNIHGIGVWARLNPGATIAGARQELGLVGRHLAEQFPNSNKGRTFIAEPLRPSVGDVQSTLWLLLGAVSLILLIACANIASLLLARAVSRDRELAMRVALGAGRGRLVRQSLTESAVLGLAGGTLGILLAAFGLRPFVAFWPGSLPRATSVHMDWRVLLFAVATSLLSGILFGLAPSLRAPARNLELALRAGGRSIGGASRRLHGGFVVVQLTLAVVLLVSSGMLARTLLQLSNVDPGIDIHNILVARAALSPSTLENPARTRAAWDDILERARRVPGVEAIAMVDTVPMRDGNNQIPYRTSAAAVPDDRAPIALASSVSPDYLHVMKLRLLAGRFFDSGDRLGHESVAVIDEVMAQQAFPGEDPLGKHVWIGLGADPARVIGVVSHVRYWGLAGDDRATVRAQLYYPFAQVPDPLVRRWSQLMSIAVRTSIPPANILESLRHELRGATRDQVLYQVDTMENLSRSTIARQRFLMLLFGIFAGLALLLSSIGIYGVMAYLTGQRVPEIGVRIALGATSRGVIRLVLEQSLVMIVGGVVLGGLAAFAAARLLQGLVEGMRPVDAPTFAAMAGVLMAAALLASYLPARRASRIDPVKALREE
ncbi:MAG TPA: ABC transporter permease [Bryobacteraceae bacterium]|jgi:predicted permease